MKKIVVFILILVLCRSLTAEDTAKSPTQLILNFNDVINLAREQSPKAIRAKHEFKANYWEYRSYKATHLPSLTLSTTPVNLDHSIQQMLMDNGNDTFMEIKSFSANANLFLQQRISLTGGVITVRSGINRFDPLSDSKNVNFNTSPLVSIGLEQPLNGYNEMRWEKKVEPLKFEQAKRQYTYEMENVSSRAIELFFDLALAQLNLEIAQTNYSNTDTLYKIAQGRYNIGTIAENELLQMELGKLNAATEMNRSTIDLIHKKAVLASFLGYNETVDIQILLPSTINPPVLEYPKVLATAVANNPDLISYDIQLLEAEKEVARARAERRFTANLRAEYGLNKTSRDIEGAYKDPGNMQQVQVGIQIPILDWGSGKGKYKMAQSNRELVQSLIDQKRTEFEQDVFLKVMQFNLQQQQIQTATKADTVARLRYELSKQRFLIGKISITDLNIALNEKDIARRGYINTIQSYFSNLYDIRRLCLYDFEHDTPLTEEFVNWIKK